MKVKQILTGVELVGADLEDKLMELAMPVVGESQARALLARIWQLNQSDNLP